MPDPVVVDVHVHVFADADDPMRDGYEIWEYGERDDVDFGERRGTVDDLLDSLTQEPCAHCVVLGMFVPDVEMDALRRSTEEADRGRTDAEMRSLLPERMRSYNQWILTTAGQSPT